MVNLFSNFLLMGMVGFMWEVERLRCWSMRVLEFRELQGFYMWPCRCGNGMF